MYLYGNLEYIRLSTLLHDSKNQKKVPVGGTFGNARNLTVFCRSKGTLGGTFIKIGVKNTKNLTIGVPLVFSKKRVKRLFEFLLG